MFIRKQKQNRKWQQRPQLYKGRFYYVKKVMQVLLGIASVCAVVAFVLYIRNSEMLGIQEVEVLGELKHLTRDDVIILSQIKKTDKLFALDFSDVQKNILKHYWVKDVRLRREFPDKIQIHIQEREPTLILVLDEMYLVDQSGVVFKKVEKDDPINLPTLTGFDRETLAKYPMLTKSYFKHCLAFFNYLMKQDFYKDDPISEIHFDSAFGFTVYTQNLGLEIYYGRDDFKIKQEKLEKFRLSKYYNETSYARLDLDSRDKIIARTN